MRHRVDIETPGNPRQEPGRDQPDKEQNPQIAAGREKYKCRFDIEAAPQSRVFSRAAFRSASPKRRAAPI